MATYFHGNTEAEGGGRDGLQTLILMNPTAYNNTIGYSSDSTQPHAPTNFIFVNSNSHHQPPLSQIQHFADNPHLQLTTTSASQQQQHQFCDLYNSLVNINGAAAEREVTGANQGLFLSLPSEHPTGHGFPSQPPVVTSTASTSEISNGAQSVVLHSKYLKAARELLDEVVHVGKGAKNASESAKQDDDGEPENTGENAGEGDSFGKRGAELTTGDKQEIQMMKVKLVNMVDEVEQRYKQYHQQIHTVTSWFERVAGVGSAKTYTSLAFQTISKQFRCLKDAISGQLRVARKNLYEDQDNVGRKIEGSTLKYVDNQRRALQQFGMIHHNAWRPQRGLPEQSISVLRAWLFEHFLHPYPKDSDKVMLAKQTGLTRSQVSNWFINARVRLWKPMVEEMYAEEMKEHYQGIGSEDKTSITEQNKVSTLKPDDDLIDQNAASVTSVSTSQTQGTTRNNVHFDLIRSSDVESISPKKQRNADILHSQRSSPSMNMESKSTNVENEHTSTKFGNFIEGFGSYPIVEQFQATYSGNGVSLTLGLPHCENISMSGANKTFLQNQSTQQGRGVQIRKENEFSGMNSPTYTLHSTSEYENINIQNRKRFAAQLLQDFVT